MAEPAFKLTPEMALDIIKRRRWVILVPLCIALLAGIYLAFTLPRVYEAKTLILVESQSVPRNFVQPIVTEDTAQRISTISQQILSRTSLEKIIKEFGLLSGPAQASLFMEDKVAELRQQISVEVSSDHRRQTDAFTISFRGEDPDVVMRVANGLATDFIDANLKVRESQAVGTSTFLESQMESMRKKLELLEEKIQDFRKEHMGELPEQLNTNLSILQRLQEGLNSRQQGLLEAKLRLAELNNQAVSKEPSVLVLDGSQRRDDGAVSLEDLRAQLESLQSRYTDAHPDIQRLKKRIAELESKSNQMQDEAAMTRHIPPVLRHQMADANREIQGDESEIENLKRQIDEYQKKVDAIPKREQELLSLNRDYHNIKTTYDSLLNRKLEADIAVSMERKQKGEQFRVLDPARVPKRPVAPNLKKLFLLVIAGGLGAGAGLALLLEIAKPTFRNPDEIESRLGLPVLVSIPRLLHHRQILLGRLNNIASIAFSVFILGLFGVMAVVSIAGTEVVLQVF
jgi:protein tyrosine kinase modulator